MASRPFLESHLELVPSETGSDGSMDNAPSKPPDSKEIDFKETPISLRKINISPRTIPGAANSANQGAIDWGECGLVAFGCNNTVVVVGTSNFQPLQTLDRHKIFVNKVLLGYGSRFRLNLVSADISGILIVWDIIKGESKCVFQDGTNPILNMAWLKNYDEGDHLLLALHAPSTLNLWDTKNKSKVWTTSYPEPLLNFDVNPFQAGEIATLTNERILLWSNFTPTSPPTSKPREFNAARPNRSSSIAEGRPGTRDHLRRFMRVVGETKPKPYASMKMRECQQLIFHRAVSNLLLLVYPLEILLLDLHINIIGIIQLERSTSPLLQIVPTCQRDVLYCLHETGSVSVRIRRRQPTLVGSPMDAPSSTVNSVETGSFSGDLYPDIGYEQRCQSEVIRQTKGSRVLGIAYDPVCERRLALFLNTGRVVFLELRLSNAGSARADFQQIDTLSDLVPSFLSDAVCSPLRLVMVNLMHVAASPLTALRMCPIPHVFPGEESDEQDLPYQPFLAIGTIAGLVQIINVSTGAVEREIAVHTHPIRGIEWTSSQTFLSWSYPNVMSGLVRNDLMLTHALIGHNVSLRSNKIDNSPIVCVRASPLRQYFIVALKDGDLELYDLKTLNLIKAVKHPAFSITALEWRPSTLSPKSPSEASTSSRGSTPNASGEEEFWKLIERETNDAHRGKPGPVLTPSKPRPSGPPPAYSAGKGEGFCLCDGESSAYLFSISGNTVHLDAERSVTRPSKSAITCLAYFNKLVILGDNEGVLRFSYKTKLSFLALNAGPIKKLVFAPAVWRQRYLLVLHVDGVTILDFEAITDEVTTKGLPIKVAGVQDIEWAGPDNPILVMHDSSIRIMDLTWTRTSSPIDDYVFEDPPICFSLLPSSVVSNFQILLATRYWELDLSKDVDIRRNPSKLLTDDGFTEKQLKTVLLHARQMEGHDWTINRIRRDGLGTADRSLLLAYYLGDINMVWFWSVALYQLKVCAAKKKQGNSDDEPPILKKHPPIPPLDSCYDVFCDASTYRRLQIERVNLYENRRGDYAQTQRVIQNLIILGETDRAVQLLLETDMDHPQYQLDATKACLIATMQSARTAAQSTFKLVATNLIAYGKIWEGVQYLCLCSKGLDACNYFLQYGMWDEAVWLAKAVLPSAEAQEVVHKWIDHLINSGRKHQALLAMLSLGQFERALKHLISHNQPAVAGLLLQACREYDLLPKHSEMKKEPFKEEYALILSVEKNLIRFFEDIGNQSAALKLGEWVDGIGKNLPP